jgi:heptosyltransferase-2
MVGFLLVRFGSAGDLLLTTPLIRHLKTQVEDAEIHILSDAGNRELLEANPHVDKVHDPGANLRSCIRDLQRQQFDYIIDLQRDVRSARIKLALKRMDFTVASPGFQKHLLHLAGIRPRPQRHEVLRNLDTAKPFLDTLDEKGLDYYPPHEATVLGEALPDSHHGGYIALALNAPFPTRQFPEDLLLGLCRKLKGPVLLLGEQADHALGERIRAALPDQPLVNRCGKHSVHQLAIQMEEARVLICPDTDLALLANALGKKVLLVWGSSLPEFGRGLYRPHPGSWDFEVKGLSCRPCSWKGRKRCPKKHFRCMYDQDLETLAGLANQ